MSEPIDVSPKPPVGPVHLGDGTYVSFDGYQLWLGANDHRRMTVALEPAVFLNLLDFAKNVGMRLPQEIDDANELTTLRQLASALHARDNISTETIKVLAAERTRLNRRAERFEAALREIGNLSDADADHRSTIVRDALNG